MEENWKYLFQWFNQNYKVSNYWFCFTYSTHRAQIGGNFWIVTKRDYVFNASNACLMLHTSVKYTISVELIVVNEEIIL